MTAKDNIVPDDPSLAPAPGQADRLEPPSAEYIQWLESRSMLHQADHLSDAISGKWVQWKNAYAHPRPKDFVRAASVWFSSYPKSLITARNQSVLQALTNRELLSTFREIGIEAIHLGPMKRAGGITGREYTPTTDGFFDRIELTMDPLFGTDDQYLQMRESAEELGIAIIGDLVPGHTGKGADFRLAERAYSNYEGLYTMVEILREDWNLLPPAPEGADSVNLEKETVQLLEDRGYIPGPLEVVIFYEPDIKETNWSATDIVTGVDGVQRRWVYLHVFKEGQPSFNWLDPTFGAHRILMADTVQSLYIWGDTGLRLDANPLLGIEGRPGLEKSWLEGHPLAEGTSNIIAMMIRKLGGYSFQELNLSLEDLKKFTVWGPELTYDFITRPPYLYAMVTGDAGPLRMILRLIQEEGVDLGIFVHALQNHDELMLDLAHLRKHKDKKFMVNGEEVSGRALYDGMYERSKEELLGSGIRYIRDWSTPGFCGTLAGLAAAAFKVADPYHMTDSQKADIQQLHLLAATFNAMQPGVFAVSGWDLVGALPVLPENLGTWMDDGDGRWMNRGAFDLMGVNPDATSSGVGLPKAVPLYGTLPEQLQDPQSFTSQLKRMLRVREEYSIAVAELVSVPETQALSLVVMLFERSEQPGWIVTALNFGREPVHETVQFPQLAGKSARLIFSTLVDSTKSVPVPDGGTFHLNLEPMQGEVFVVE